MRTDILQDYSGVVEVDHDAEKAAKMDRQKGSGFGATALRVARTPHGTTHV